MTGGQPHTKRDVGGQSGKSSKGSRSPALSGLLAGCLGTSLHPLLFGEAWGRGTAPRQSCCGYGWSLRSWSGLRWWWNTSALRVVLTHEERPAGGTQGRARRPHARRKPQARAGTGRERRAKPLHLRAPQMGAMRRPRDGPRSRSTTGRAGAQTTGFPCPLQLARAR